jgi:hypothetical protein
MEEDKLSKAGAKVALHGYDTSVFKSSTSKNSKAGTIRASTYGKGQHREKTAQHQEVSAASFPNDFSRNS